MPERQREREKKIKIITEILYVQRHRRSSESIFEVKSWTSKYNVVGKLNFKHVRA